MKTIWNLEPHTRAKHEILRRYLQAWFAILRKVSPSGLNYIDGFAGPGIYSKGEDGSPVIAIQTAIEHRLPLPRISFVFVEKEKEIADQLESVLSARFPNPPGNISYEVYNGEFAHVITGILDRLDTESKIIAPTFTFVDPFGYSGFPMGVLQRLMEATGMELLITFMASRVRRFLDPQHETAMDSLYCSPDWRNARNIKGPNQISYLMRLYVKCLSEKTAAKYVMPFEMADSNGNTIYYLVFATKHPRGLDVMKEAMWKVDPSGTYRFYDYADGVRRLELSERGPEWSYHAQNLVFNHFKGKAIAVEDVEDFVRQTPFLWRKKRILLPLEERGLILNVAGRSRTHTYPEGSVIAFADEIGNKS
jgi:three-Cys-motif partner protein